MIPLVLAAVAGAAVALAAILAFELANARRDLSGERARVDALLDRVQSRSLAEYVAVAPSAPAGPPPRRPEYISDPTGLMVFEDTDG